MGKVGISFAIGGSIAAVIMVIGMVTIVADTATPATTSLGIQGHYFIKIMDSDGNIKAYIQTQNEPTHLLKDCIQDSFWGTSVAATNCGITSMELAVGDGGETAPTDADTDLGNRYDVSGNGTALIGTGADAPTGSAAGQTTVTWQNSADPITITQQDLDDSTTGNAGDDGACIQISGGSGVDCLLDETGLYNSSGALLSHATFGQVEVSVGDQVDIELLITLS